MTSIGKFLILNILLIIILSCSDEDKSYSFFVAGHVYGTPGVDNIGVYPPFKRILISLKENPEIKFGLLGGDSVIQPTIKNWDELDNDMMLVGKPIYLVKGNHDISAEFDKRYTQNGKSYYSFNIEQDLFIILDANIDSWSIRGEQLDFLKNSLTDMYKRVFIFTHQIIWYDKEHDKCVQPNSFSGYDNPNFWSEVFTVLKSIKSKIYIIAGDAGAFAVRNAYSKYVLDNIQFYSTGMGGGVNDNILMFKVAKNNVSINLVRLDNDGIAIDFKKYNVTNCNFSS